MYALPTTDSLLDIVLGPRQSSGAQLCFLDDERVFIDVFSGEDRDATCVGAAPPTLKIRRLGPLTRVPDGSFWKAEEFFEVCVECSKYGSSD